MGEEVENSRADNEHKIIDFWVFIMIARLLRLQKKRLYQLLNCH